MNNNKELVKATLQIYKESALKSLLELKNNWIIIIATIVAYLIFSILSSTLGSANNLITGLLLGLAFIAFLTLFYSWIFDLAQGQKLKWNQLHHFDGELFNALMSTGFILWIANDFLLDPLLNIIQKPNLKAALQMLIVIIFNPIAETVAFRRYSSIAAFKHAADFTKANWIEWFCPFILLMSPIMILIDPMLILSTLSGMALLFPTQGLIGIWAGFINLFIPASTLGVYLSLICALIIAIFYALFRAHLFIALETGSRRQRIFRARM